MSCCVIFYLLTKKLSAAMMTSWIPNFSGFMKKSRTEAEVLGQRSLSHDSKPPLTHVTDLSLDSGPELVGDTEILAPEHISKLAESFPARLVGVDWRLIYSTSVHGFSLSSLYRRCSETTGPTLVCIEDTNENIFGALISNPIRMSESFYGTGESFLFQTKPQFKIYNWSGENLHFARGNVDSLSFGAGEGQFGLYLDSSLYQGRSQSCSTFDNQPLVPGGGDFLIKTVECWAFD